MKEKISVREETTGKEEEMHLMISICSGRVIDLLCPATVNFQLHFGSSANGSYSFPSENQFLPLLAHTK
jgi:hypothetical protein